MNTLLSTLDYALGCVSVALVIALGIATVSTTLVITRHVKTWRNYRAARRQP